MIRNLCLTVLIILLSNASSRASGNVARGPAIPIEPGDEPWVITKLRVTDSRVVRGFVGAPVDGARASGAWDGRTWAYPMRNGGVGVEYIYMDNDGLHLTFADDEGFNAVVVRGGIKARLLRDVRQYDQPESGELVHEFPGGATTSRAWFDEPIRTTKVSFFDVSDGLIADTSFFRVRRGTADLDAQLLSLPTDIPDPGRRVNELTTTTDREASLAAMGVDFILEELPADGELSFTISIPDPLNPRLELHAADYVLKETGRIRIVCDFPDQVIPASATLSVTLEYDQPATISQLRLEQYHIPRERAIVEALAHRKFILQAIYTPVSEARPWNIWNNPGDDEAYLNAPPDTGNELQDRLRPWVRDIVMTLAQCRELDPEGNDPVVRQMHEWIYRKIIRKSPGGMPEFSTKFNAIEGVPEWAALVHQAWMQARQVPEWWIDHRLAPNGEFGGLLADDTDMYQNYAPFPMLERDGVGGMLLDAGARMAELLEYTLLEEGINRESMDPLHAYEEGLNHEALMAYWNYGDPIYLERCMIAARSTEKLTMVTERGHRHFPGNALGIEQTRVAAEPDSEHGSHCLMWHPTLIVAWYNRHPLAMQWLCEWGDGWLEHMQPPDYATHVKLPEDQTMRSEAEPFAGGWGMVGSVFMFLSDLTGDRRFIEPYLEYFARTGRNTGIHLPEILQMGMLDSPQQTVSRTEGAWPAVLYALNNSGPWHAKLYTTGDKQPFIDAIRRDIEELQRFPHMYTTVECFTDRVFLYPIINPSIAYTGGYTTRNKLNLTYAITWDGFGTDYAALVTSATADQLKVLLCNLSDEPISGRGRLWRLEHGEYELTFGPDADQDDHIDQPTRAETLTIARGQEIELTLPPKVVHILELRQRRKLEPIYDRADLALSPRAPKVENGSLRLVAHNIGAADVDEVVVALVNDQGKTVQTKKLGALAAPLDLEPKRIEFSFDGLPGSAQGWSVVIDPEDKVVEIFEGNNRLTIGE